MIHWLRRLWLNFTAPVPDDEALSRQILFALLFGSLLGVGTMLVALVVMAPSQWWPVTSLAIMASWVLLCLGLAYRGRLSLATWLFVAGNWIIATLLYLGAGGVHSPGFTGGYMLAVIMSSLLISASAGFLSALLSVVATLAMSWLEQTGRLPPPLILPAPGSVLAMLHIIFILTTAVILYLTTRTTRLAFTNSQQRAAEIARNNKALEQARRSLQEGRDELAEAYARLQEEGKEREASEARFHHLVESARDAIFTLDHEGTITSLNPAFTSLTGWRREQWLGHHFADLVHEEDIAAVYRALEEVGAKKAAPLELRIRVAAGDYSMSEVTLSTLNRDGQIHSVLGVARDVTERKRSEAALHQRQKLESLGVLAGGVAHDFNNLLVAMMSQTSLALARLPELHPARSHVEKAMTATERAADLTHQLLAYSGAGHFIIRPLRLNELVADNYSLWQVALPKQVSLHLELAPELPAILADAGQIQQIVMNLVLNGAEAIGPDGGQVVVRTGLEQVTVDDERFGHYLGQPLAPGNYVLLEVQDTGQGMAPETVARIFDPFYTTKETGRGLGLAAVLGIVRGHRGGLHVTSQPGRGTTFILLFPPSPTGEDNLPAQMPEALRHSGAILVIDDEAGVREAIADVGELEGFAVMTAASGEEGLERYREEQAKIDLVLLDLSMPGLSGEETFVRLQEINPAVRVILSSGYNQREAIRRFAGSERADFLQKPYDLATLLAILRANLPAR